MGEMVLDPSKIEVDEDGKKVGYSGPRLVVIFPDTGSAVWSEQDWKAGKFGKSAKVPPSVRCAAFPNEMVDAEKDAVRLALCCVCGVWERWWWLWCVRAPCKLSIHSSTHPPN